MSFSFLPILLAPTFALVINLAKKVIVICPSLTFCLFLNNLFLKLNVAQALLAIGVLCIGTSRKNSKGLPQELIDLKNRNRSLLWNSALARIVNSVYCFLWQDNNAVLRITTAYSLSDRILRERKRPALTSTNARVVRPVFGNAVRKWLYIPTAIDNYNHHMNGVDRNNQLRRNMTVCRASEHRNWRPMWHWQPFAKT
jgi:Transposase IS4